MNFAAYQKKFTEKAIAAGKDNSYISGCLAYAKPLLDKGFPVIYDERHLAQLTGVRLEFLYAMAYGTKRFYRYFTIPKKNGKKRKISEPLPMLKGVQHFILQNILIKMPCDPCAKAYKPGASLKGNARFHRAQPVVIKLDIQDYFPSLHVSTVYSLFHTKFGYSQRVAILLARLCTLNESIPQGAPTSPYLSNLLTADMDRDIYAYCQGNGRLRYTRYADDITISGSCDPHEVIPTVSEIVKKHCLRINNSKTNVVGAHRCQMVTGVVVNQKLQAPKNYRRRLRLELYYCKKYGMEEHLLHGNQYPVNLDLRAFCQSLLGKVNYCLLLNNADAEMQAYRTYLLGKMTELDAAAKGINVH